MDQDRAGMQYECPSCRFYNTVPDKVNDGKCSACGGKINVWSRNPLTGMCEKCTKKMMDRLKVERCLDCGRDITGFERYLDSNVCMDCFNQREKLLKHVKCDGCGNDLNLFNRIANTNYCFECTDKMRQSNSIKKCSNCGIPLDFTNMEPDTTLCTSCRVKNPELSKRAVASVVAAAPVTSSVQKSVEENSDIVTVPSSILDDTLPGEKSVTDQVSGQNPEKGYFSKSKPEGKKKKARWKILFGLMWLVGGIIATAASDGELLFWGAIVFGAIDVIVGIFQGINEGF